MVLTYEIALKYFENLNKIKKNIREIYQDEKCHPKQRQAFPSNYLKNPSAISQKLCVHSHSHRERSLDEIEEVVSFTTTTNALENFSNGNDSWG